MNYGNNIPVNIGNIGSEHANVAYASMPPTSMQPSLEKAMRGRVETVERSYNSRGAATRSRSPSPPAYQTATMLPAPDTRLLVPFVNTASPQTVRPKIVNPLTRELGTRRLSVNARRRRALRRTRRFRRNSRRFRRNSRR